MTSVQPMAMDHAPQQIYHHLCLRDSIEMVRQYLVARLRPVSETQSLLGLTDPGQGLINMSPDRRDDSIAFTVS